VERAKTKALVV